MVTGDLATIGLGHTNIREVASMNTRLQSSELNHGVSQEVPC